MYIVDSIEQQYRANKQKAVLTGLAENLFC